jgi:hypothetical protein
VPFLPRHTAALDAAAAALAGGDLARSQAELEGLLGGAAFPGQGF